MAKADPDFCEQLRNSVIQCFEFTYELSHKMLKRHLEETSASPEEVDLGTFQNLIRTGNQKGLLRSDWLRWRTYRQARTDSSHTYNESKAEAVYSIAPDFLEEEPEHANGLRSRTEGDPRVRLTLLDGSRF